MALNDKPNKDGSYGTEGVRLYRVRCFWQMSGEYEIWADSKDEAQEVAGDVDLPANKEYVDGSFEIESDFIDGVKVINCPKEFRMTAVKEDDDGKKLSRPR